MTMGGLAMALDVDIDTAADLLEQVKATTPSPARNIRHAGGAREEYTRFPNERPGHPRQTPTPSETRRGLSDQGMAQGKGQAKKNETKPREFDRPNA